MRFTSLGVRLAIIALALCGPDRGARAEPFTVVEAVGRAFLGSPAIGTSAAASDEAQGEVRETGAARYPSIRLSAAANRYEDPTIVYPFRSFDLSSIPPFDRTVYQSGLDLSYTLYDGGSRGARLRQAHARAASREAALDAAKQTVATRVIAAYLEILSRREVLDAQGQRLAALAAERTRVTQLLAAGKAAPVERFRVDAAIASAEADRVSFAAALGVAEGDLARLTGEPLERTRASELRRVALTDTLPPEPNRVLAAALERSPVLAQARALASAAAAGSRVARGKRYPSIVLAGAYNGWADSKGDDRTAWNAGAQFSLPVFTGGAVSGGIERADASRRGAAEQLRLSEEQLRENVDGALASVAEAHARVRSLGSAVASLEEVARIEKLALDAGSGTQTDYLSAEADLLAARANLVNARYREIVTRVDLARITGGLSLDWLAQNLESKP